MVATPTTANFATAPAQSVIPRFRGTHQVGRSALIESAHENRRRSYVQQTRASRAVGRACETLQVQPARTHAWSAGARTRAGSTVIRLRTVGVRVDRVKQRT
jgi:hypothetical protein